MDAPRFASALIEGGSLSEALDRAADQALAELDGARPDLAVLFVQTGYGTELQHAGSRVVERTRARHLIGCTASGVVGTGIEIEGRPAVSLLLACLPGAHLVPFSVAHDDLMVMSEPDDLRSKLGLAVSSKPRFLLLSDPFTSDPDLVLHRFRQAYPECPASGGLVSGGTRPGRHVMYLDGRAVLHGTAGLAITEAAMDTVVSQGCRPVGRRFVITRSVQQKVFELSGQPALQAIQLEIAKLPDDDQQLARSNLLVGRVCREAQAEFGRGDFLIRNFVAASETENAVVIADHVRVGQTIQLQLRDVTTATEDLRESLVEASGRGEVRAQLTFTCAGRGRGMFGEPHFEARTVQHHLGAVPAAGFFCNGEYGPVGGDTFLHGFTASLALFR